MATLRATAAAKDRHNDLKAKQPKIYKPAAKTPAIPHTAFMRELHLLDGRPILVDRRVIGFVTTGRAEKFEGKTPTIVAWETWAQSHSRDRGLRGREELVESARGTLRRTPPTCTTSSASASRSPTPAFPLPARL